MRSELTGLRRARSVWLRIWGLDHMLDCEKLRFDDKADDSELKADIALIDC